MALGDPPDYSPDLKVANEQLSKTTASLKHIIMLGDGDTPFQVPQSTVEAMHAHGITVSTVAVGADANGAALELLPKGPGANFRITLKRAADPAARK